MPPNTRRKGAHMTKADIAAGICGFATVVKARMEGSACTLSIESECDAIQRMASELTQVDPFREFTFRGAGPLTYQTAAKDCKHAACPVPVGIIKAIEVEAGLALPADVTIKLSKSDE
jgi:hypothetical protein